MVPSEGRTSLKNPVTPPGIDPGTVLLVAQRLNHYATSGPDLVKVVNNCYSDEVRDEVLVFACNSVLS